MTRTQSFVTFHSIACARSTKTVLSFGDVRGIPLVTKCARGHPIGKDAGNRKEHRVLTRLALLYGTRTILDIKQTR